MHELAVAHAIEIAPVNFWAGALILAIAVDINRPHFGPGRGK